MFMDEEFLLSTDIAKTLYHEGVSRLPVIDYHCHVDPRAIAEDICYEDIAQLWLGEDHYKWRLMRWYGVEERLVTGNAPGKEKFLTFAACLPKAMSRMVLRRRSGSLVRVTGRRPSSTSAGRSRRSGSA